MNSRKPFSGKPGFELLLKALVVFLSAAVLLGLFMTVRLLLDAPRPGKENPYAPAGQALTMPEDFLPQNLAVGQTPPDIPLTEEDGRTVRIGDLAAESGGGTWLVFWASWCPDCTEQFAVLNAMARLAEENGVELILIDRLNPERETKEKAREKLSSFGAAVRCVYDEEEACYRAWGMREIPGHVMLDQNGVVKEYYSGTMTAGQCAGLLFRLKNGRAAAGLSYIFGNFWVEEGGVATSTEASGASPAGRDVLSESQGLMLGAALEMEDQALFDSVLAYTENYLMDGGLSMWYHSTRNGRARVNALLDDLRIWDALRRAENAWGSAYAERAAELREAIFAGCVNAQGDLVDYIETDTGKQAASISLCYLDLEILARLAAEDPRFQPALDKAQALVLGGRISDAFPLYYSGYDYAAGEYSRNDLNTSEALYTLWNLSRADALPEDALAWLREQVKNGALAARYKVNGEAVPGYEYHSTAAYGLSALIALEAGDGELLEISLRRMERKLVLDANDRSFGGYRQKGVAAYAFDQLIPLLVNLRVDRGVAQ